jgi:hypothetical protein
VCSSSGAFTRIVNRVAGPKVASAKPFVDTMPLFLSGWANGDCRASLRYRSSLYSRERGPIFLQTRMTDDCYATGGYCATGRKLKAPTGMRTTTRARRGV